MKRVLARQRLEKAHAEGPDIRALVEGKPARLLLAHVSRRSDAISGGGASERSRTRPSACRLRFQDLLREAEIENLDDTLGGDLHVLRLQIAMDDAFGVCRFEGECYLSEETESLSHRHGALLQPSGEGPRAPGTRPPPGA